MLTKRLAIVTLFSGLAAAPAFAHPGHHEEMTFWQGAAHLFSSPDHLLMLGLIVLAAVFGGRFLWRRLSKRT